MNHSFSAMKYLAADAGADAALALTAGGGQQLAPDGRAVPLRSDEQIVRLRQIVREAAVALGFSLVEQTKFVTAASELARNTLRYGGGGDAYVEIFDSGARRGLRLSFIDAGPGIPDIDAALRDGFTTGGGLGLGLGGAKRLCDEFSIQSAPGRGTRISIAKWKSF